MEKILQTYLRRLTNLSANNRSLLLLRLISDQFIDLHDLDYANNSPSFKIIEDLISGSGKIQLCQEFDSRDPNTNVISQRLKKIERIEQFIFQERGAKDLYVGWPFVRGKFNDGTLVRCPLIFFPVSLNRVKNMWTLEKRPDVNITFNKTLLLGYSYYNQVALKEDLIEFVLNDLDTDSTVYRTQLYEILKNNNLEINFNQENFIDQLKPFTPYKKATYIDEQKEGQLKLFPEAVLGIFPQAGSYLVPDYVKLIESDVASDLADFFVSKVKSDPEEEQNIRPSDKVTEETTFTPFDIDASQEEALRLVKKGNSLTVQGPPGTGKSQLICNLISDFIGRGKNVLLVCQKRAALDVVYRRLMSQELHDFVGLVHDFKNDRKDIFGQIARQIESLDDYRQKNNGLDAIHLERVFQQCSRKIDQITEELHEFKDALFDESECGKAIKELYLISNPDEPFIALNQEYRSFDYKRLPEFVNRLDRFIDYYHLYEKRPHFWSLGPSFYQFGTQDLLRLKEVLSEIPEFNEALKKESQKFARASLDFESCLHFISKKEELQQLRNNLDNETVFKYFKHMMAHEPDENPLWLSNMERTMLQCFKSAGMETSLPSRELGRFQEALEHAIRARKGLFKWLRWKWFSDEKIFITRVLVANGLKSNKEGFEIILQRIDNRLNYEHIVSKIGSTPWLTDFPTSFRKIDIQNWFFYQKIALKCIQLARTVRTIDQFLPTGDLTSNEYVAKLDTLLTFLEKVPTQLGLWSRYVSEKQIRSILLGKEKVSEMSAYLNEHFDSLVEYHKLKEGFSSQENKVIEEILHMTEGKKEKTVRILKNSVALAWIDHIEGKYPILRAVSSLKLDHLTKDLQQAIADKAEASQAILLLKSRERTYTNLEYNRLNNMVTYKDLYHQVTKKRKIWPIRKVISQFREETFALLPCWLASPESASAIFPMEEMFDLVIFDEASQCFAERGIPAMYRGKQVVIAGDDQQLRPNDLYRVRWEDQGEDDSPELEADSLLELAKRYLKEVALRGHYRSKSLELIEFSNLHFYKGKLKMLPDYSTMNAEIAAIQYLKVNGTWKDNTNLSEAQTVVDLVWSMTGKKPDKTIGVVTFNISQQNLILDLLEEKQTKGKRALPEHVFVKNIENVQGDERDIIIFSTAYAPDEKGKLQLRFGSLNNAGGENRLNVAITRAKENIYIVTSLLPHELLTENTTHKGPKLLKSYLEYAKQVSEGTWRPDKLQHKEHGQEWYLRNKLKGEYGGVVIDKLLPFADLTVMQSNQSKGLILTDDDLFHDTLSPKEAHAYRPSHFIGKGWPFTSFFSREYWINRNQAVEKLEKFVSRVKD